MALLLLSLRSNRGHYIFRQNKIFLALPGLLNAFITHKSLGWIYIFCLELFARYHPTSSVRDYENGTEYTKSHLESLVQGSDHGVTLNNKDSLILANEDQVKQMKEELTRTYANDDLSSEKPYKEEQLIQLFDSLEPLDSNLMLKKQFDGFVVPCSPHQVLNLVFPSNQGKLKDLKWGKVFFSRHESEPIVLNYKKKYYFSLPGSGTTSLIDIKFRDKLSAAMQYQIVPVTDHFRILREKSSEGGLMLLGMYMMKEKLGGFFVLREDCESVLFS